MSTTPTTQGPTDRPPSIPTVKTANAQVNTARDALSKILEDPGYDHDVAHAASVTLLMSLNQLDYVKEKKAKSLGLAIAAAAHSARQAELDLRIALKTAAAENANRVPYHVLFHLVEDLGPAVRRIMDFDAAFNDKGGE